MSSPTVTLRPVEAGDLPAFFEHQRDPESVRMAAFKSRDREAFDAHWAKILADPTLVARTIVADGQVAGNAVIFGRDGEREVGYWIARELWGKGIATRALAALLDEFDERPLHARAALHNVGSQKVLERCGFREIGREEGLPGADGTPVVDVIYRLGGEES